MYGPLVAQPVPKVAPPAGDNPYLMPPPYHDPTRLAKLLAAMPPPDPFDDHDEYGVSHHLTMDMDMDDLPAGPMCAAFACTLLMVSIVITFLALAIYALVTAHSDAVQGACGIELWAVVLARMLLSLPLDLYGLWVKTRAVNLVQTSAATGVVTGLLSLLIVVACFVLESLYLHRAFSSAQCFDALGAAAPGPMLLVVGVILAIFDGWGSLLSLFALCGLSAAATAGGMSTTYYGQSQPVW